VERVANVLPQLQVTVIGWYSGWMPFFMSSSAVGREKGREL
jgi:hypothetical protein